MKKCQNYGLFELHIKIFWVLTNLTNAHKLLTIVPRGPHECLQQVIIRLVVYTDLQACLNEQSNSGLYIDDVLFWKWMDLVKITKKDWMRAENITRTITYIGSSSSSQLFNSFKQNAHLTQPLSSGSGEYIKPASAI